MPETVPAESLYVHVPFCRRKCAYCDFYSVAGADARLMDRYVAAIESEALAFQELAGPLRTVYIGGGTPTELPMGVLVQLLDVVASRFDLSPLSEFTVEANPASLSREHLLAVVGADVTRISLGVQSLNDAALRVLGRLHSAAEARNAVEMIRQDASEADLSVDLIFGLPDQSLEACLADARAIATLGAEHVSAYGLSVEPGTPLGARVAARELAPPEDELYADMILGVRDVLEEAGYEHYEISNYARGGHRCRHNMAYWRNLPYLGLGPAAASYVAGVRRTNVADVEAYIDAVRRGRPATALSERLGPLQRAGETAMLALRTSEGIRREPFLEATGYDPVALFADAIARHASSGFLALEGDGDVIRLSRSALPVADAVMADFLI